MEDLLQVIVSIQKELIQMLCSGEVGEKHATAVTNGNSASHNGGGGRRSNTFIGFVVKKSGNEGDLGFSMRKLESWGEENLCGKKLDGFKPYYIHSIHSNHQNKTVYATLNRVTLLENLLKSTWKTKVEIVNDHIKETSQYTLQCHLDDNHDSITNLRALLYTLFVQRLMKSFQVEVPHILCSVRASDCSKNSSNGLHISSNGSCAISNRSLSFCLFSAEDVALVESDLSLRHLKFTEGDAIGDMDCCHVVDDLKKRFAEFVCEKEEVGDESERVDIDLKKFVQSCPVKKCCYSKGIESIQISDSRGKPSYHISNILKTSKVFGGDIINTIHFGSASRLVHVEKTMLLTEMMSPNINMQKVCVFSENRKAMIDTCLREREQELFISYQSRYGNIVKGTQWDNTIHNVAVSSLTLDLLSITLNKPFNTKHVENTCLSSRKSVFLLYNYARLCKILQHFQEKVDQGLYEKLPEVESVRFALLTDELEWKLVVRYLLLYPNIVEHIRRSVCYGECGRMQLPVNLLCAFLCDFCHEFSSYYHQTKVLLDPRPHLAPLMFARLYLIVALKKMMDDCFTLLGIVPPHQM